ncbi:MULTISPECIES: FAD-dependent monooxygenase [unclassified Arthrobacter]|uniref:FAD-dependent monooxygenase n=1 Tax=unclassified Arthrobacter TaxID=235627 RepID=UPI001E3E831A|nr:MULTISPECIES: FAD-dependent monooxygenase [unclassified Arthrobacter]MCC9144480.1 FAD-dependent monooxygenase [Arthrobacter sp. zg-Y919]MDK1275706.1 FAD-dependent monooxygenase [Arthrobacter sp. zg.Y919]WIB02927.1 FAD-dependent monooxygenase [Arthrobacter sp. zg-Y919]
MRGSALIVGAGIAGTAVARGLLRAGWSVRVLERSAHLPGSGTALAMWPEAMKALDALGAGDAVRAGSVEEHGARLLKPDGSQIAAMGRGRTARMVPRTVLMDALSGDLPAGVIEWNSPVAGPSSLPDAAIVVAADGISSRLRAAYLGAPPRALGTVAFRGVVSGPAGGVTETWGRGRLFGITPLDPGNTNWFACLRSADLPPLGSPEAFSIHGADLLRSLYHGWHPDVTRVLGKLDGSPLDYRELFDVPPLRSYISGNVALLGDAAHGMAPNLGRGACEALLDAVALVDALSVAPDVPAALQRYDAGRRRRGNGMVRAARLLNGIGTAKRFTGIRNLAVSAAARFS